MKLTPLCLAAILLLQLPAATVHAQAVASDIDQATAARIDAVVAPYYKASAPGATAIVTRRRPG